VIQVNNLIVILLYVLYIFTNLHNLHFIRCTVVAFYVNGIVAVFYYVNRCFLFVSDDVL